ncbi:MAG: glutamate 5-kinase [Lachnospiraceae bacterium]|nr:glutamate 5-kinase [Lachnospiraceae bacterium]
MALYQNRIVVKVGTSALTGELGNTDLRAFDRISCVLSDIQSMGYQVILVSSGAIAVGTNKLNMKARPGSMRLKQAAAAVGQCQIIFLYDKFFGDYDKTIAQILLSAEDIRQEEKKWNLQNTFDALLEMGIIPVVNENDSVSYTEIEGENRVFGDNDRLSAEVAVLTKASRLIILGESDGLTGPSGILTKVEAITDEIYALAETQAGRKGGAGLKTKLQAASIAGSHGIDTYILSGKKPEAIYDILEGKPAGTEFTGKK